MIGGSTLQNLKKILFILLFFSTAVPSVMQAKLLNWAALIEAVFWGRLGIVRLLLIDIDGADVDLVNKVLIEAASKDYLEIVKLLLANKSDVDYQNSFGKTALMIVAEREKHSTDQEKKQKLKNIIGQLLAADANPLVKAKNGTTALELSETIREHMREKTSGTLMEVVSRLSLDLANLIPEFIY